MDGKNAYIDSEGRELQSNELTLQPRIGPHEEMEDASKPNLKPDASDHAIEPKGSTLSTPHYHSQPITTQPVSRLRIACIMSSFCAGGALVSMDSVIVSVALPSIAHSFSMTTTQYSWVGSSYLLAEAALMPLWGPMSDSIGRKIILIGGLLLFLLGSLVSAMACDSNMLIAGRTVQGLGGGAFTVMTNICMADLFPLRQRSLYIAMYAGASCVGAAFGPLLGGAFTQYLNWRWCFWINLPVTAVAVCLASAFLPFPTFKLSGKGLTNVDWLGMVLVTVATLMLLLGLQFGDVNFPWNSATTIGLLIAGVFTFLLFVFQQTRSPYPIIPLKLFRHRSGCACLLVCVSHGFTYIACLFYLPVYLQLVLRFSSMSVGICSLITAGPTTVVTIATALVVQKTGYYRNVICFSAASLTLAVGLFISLQPERDWARIVLFQLILALGIGPLFQAPLIGLQASVDSKDVSSAYGTYIFLRTLSSAISLVIGQVVLQNGLKGQSAKLLAKGIPQNIVTTLSHRLGLWSDSAGLTRGQEDQLRASLNHALSRVWVVYTVLAAVGLVASCFIQDDKLKDDSTEQG